MRDLDNRLNVSLIILSITQLIGWGSVNFLPVVSRDIASDFGLDVSVVFASTTLFYITMALSAPFLVGFFQSFGTRNVMLAGTVLSAIGLSLLAWTHSAFFYFSAWLVLGLAGSATLTTPAHILLNEIAGRKAAGAIATLMLVSGLYGTVFWPLASFLSAHIGWRGMCWAYALALVLVSVPLCYFGLPQSKTISPAAEKAPAKAAMMDQTFLLVVTVIALNAFVTFGFSAILIELLQAKGLNLPLALGFASALGIVQVGARALNIVVGKRWDGVAIAFFATVILCLSLVVLFFAQGSLVATGLFLALYGLGSGCLAVARSTIPLVFYDKAAFAKALSLIALPFNFISALSPPILVFLLTQYGAYAVLLLCIICLCTSLIALSFLMQKRPALI